MTKDPLAYRYWTHPAIKRLLKQISYELKEVELFEIHGAFGRIYVPFNRGEIETRVQEMIYWKW